MKQTDIEKAIEKEIPKEPRKYELGGDYYYRCHWLICNEPLKKWWNYCPNCGSKILWKE